jgi:putative SOS response-associated peptidase YedK
VCGRFTLTRSGRELAQAFALEESPAAAARFNIAPTQEVLAVRQEESGRRIASLRWGLVPHWASDPTIGNRMINARSETVSEKRAYRDAFRRRRCLVAADGFYEWAAGRSPRIPHLFRVRRGGIFGIAGLWESWSDPAGGRLESCTLLTTDANAAVRPLHDRMPVILDPDAYDAWLSPETADLDALRGLLAPCPADWLESTPVCTRINDPRNDDPACLEPPPPEPEALELFPR